MGGGAGWFIQSYFAQPKKKRERKRELGERESETELNVYNPCFRFIYIYCCASDRVFFLFS